MLNIPIVGYNYGYNNPNEEFENPHISSAEGVFTVTYSKPSGNIWNIDVTVGNQEQMDLSYKYLLIAFICFFTLLCSFQN